MFRADYQSATAQMGLYIINVDNEGERSFTYWQDISAAPQVVGFLNNNLRNKEFELFDLIF